jgi:glycosyltransferase involved in cell wall biosynthesis
MAGADVVHAHGLRAGALAVLAARSRTRRPAVVVTVHNAPVGGVAVASVTGVLERVVAHGADAVLAVSGDLVARQRALGARDVGRALVPAPAREATAAPAEAAGEVARAVRARLGVPPGAALLVSVARLAPQKGLDVLADSLALLAARRPDLAVHAVVAGEGPLRAALESDAAARGLPLHLLGRCGEVADLLVAADLAVLPSRWEGQSLAVQEALRAGAALVATSAGGTAEVTGDAARLVPAGDARALAEAVADLLDDPAARAELRRRARDRAGTLPTTEAATAQVEALYARLAAHSGRGSTTSG